MRILVAMVVVVRVLVPALFLLLVPLTTTWAAGGLSVTTPNGGQKWTIGKQYLIKWRKGTAGTSVRISLTKSGRHYKWISKKTRNDGRYTWKIPTSVAAGSAYKIKIKSVKKKKVLDSSNRYFTIKNAGTSAKSVSQKPMQGDTVRESSADQTSIRKAAGRGSSADQTSIRKAAGRESLADQTSIRKLAAPISPCDYNFKWNNKTYTYRQLPKHKALYVVRTDRTLMYAQWRASTRTLAKVYARNGCLAQNKGTCVVWDINASRCKKKAGTSSKLRVIKPNGGEKYVIGKKMLIRWTKGTAGTFVRIYLMKAGRSVGGSVKTRNDGRQTLTLRLANSPGSNYKVKIQSVTKSHIYDYSNRNFTIKKKGGSPPGVNPPGTAPPSSR